MEWTLSNHGENYYATLASGLQLKVVRDLGSKDGPPPKYRVSVFQSKLTKLFDTAEEAKAAAIRVAQKKLTEAVQNIKS